jgi:hypothetical protein
MTSEQVMLIGVVLLLGSCTMPTAQTQTPPAPITPPQLWAVAPLRNESGSAYADGLMLADSLVQQFEGAPGVDVLPVNRTLAAMAALEMDAPASPKDALKLMGTLGADALVVGTITAYDPYDPPKLGLALELYTRRRPQGAPLTDLRKLVRQPVGQGMPTSVQLSRQPVALVSAVFDAGDVTSIELLDRYIQGRGPDTDDHQTARLHRISMDLFSQFVSHVMSRRLLEARLQRLAALTLSHVPDR